LDTQLSDREKRLVLDEIQSSVRRKLSRRMERLGLWIETGVYRNISAAQRVRGDALRDETCMPREMQSGVDGAEAVFGVSPQQFNSGLPRALVFGYDMSSGFYSFLTGSESPSANAAILGSIFNLGISLFDHTCDNCAGGLGELSHVFDEDMLLRLTLEPRAHLDLAEVAETVVSPEVRMLLQTISGFFLRLESFSQVSRGSDAWKKLNELMIRAYRAQIRCTQARGSNTDTKELLSFCKAKSTLPFRIILQINRVCENRAHGARENSVEQLVRQVAMSFWLIDDLMDLARDFRKRDANVILLRAAADSPPPGGKIVSHGERFPDERYIDSAIEEACANLLAVQTTLFHARIHPSSANPFSDVILTYARRWVE
jgi:hypothetical protein